MVSVGDRISERLAATGVTQAELARRVKLSQPAVNGLIRGSSRSTTHLHKIARELGTTPAYLSGETDDPLAGAPDLPPLTSDHRRLIECFDALDGVQQSALLTIAMSMVGRPSGTHVNSPKIAFRGENKAAAE